MPPRLRIASKRILATQIQPATPYICFQCRQASLATAPAVNAHPDQAPPIARYPPTQPPSYKRPEFRKTQLHRQYQSLLRTTPLFLIFQHNNLKSTEWMGIRRELTIALEKVDAEAAKRNLDGASPSRKIGEEVKIQTIQTGIFASALKVVELWDQSTQASSEESSHGLSPEAYVKAKNTALNTGLEPLLSGPLALLTFPAVSPQHLKAALTILSPGKDFPAPKRRAAPGLYEPAVQNGLQKLMLLGARVEGQVFDMDGTRWVGGIEGGIDGLRAQLVAMLQGFGAGLTTTLESASRSLYVTMEGRKGMLEEEGKEATKEGQQ